VQRHCEIKTRRTQGQRWRRSVRKERKHITHEEVAMWINMVQNWDADAKEGSMHGTKKCKIKYGRSASNEIVLGWVGMMKRGRG
jgi:hypothetical protein